MLASFPVAVKIFFQQIGKEKHLKDSKHKEELNDNYQPQLPPPAWYGSEAVPVETENIAGGIFY